MNKVSFFAAPSAGIGDGKPDTGANGLLDTRLDATSDATLHAAFFAFNRLPSRYLHRSWRTAFTAADLSDFLFDGAFAHKLLSDYICQENKLSDIDFADRFHPAVRIGMQLDETQFQALCRWIGLALIGQPIKLVIAGKEIASWIAALGEPLFRFACRNAPLLELKDALLAAPPDVSTPLHPDTVADRATAVGQQFLSAGSSLIDNAIGQRLRFKLPRQISLQSGVIINPTHYSEVWTWIDRIWNCMPMRISPSPIQTLAVSR